MGLGAMAPVRVGVMGCASIARRRILPALVAVPDAEVVAIASRDPGKARWFTEHFGGRPVHGYGALLELDDVEAVYVPLPAALHAPWVEAALLAGKHVLAEKPLTTNAASTRELIDLARARGLVLRENVMFVHHHQHAEVQRLLREGAIGEVQSFHAAFAIPELPPDDIRYQPDIGGGALLDVGLYPVRGALHFLSGELKVAEAVLTTSARHPVETGGSAQLRTDTGVIAELEFGLVHAYRSRYELVGGDGRIIVDQAFTPPADHRPVLRLERRGGVEEITLPSDDQVTNAVVSFATAVRMGAELDDASVRQAVLLDDIRGNASLLPPS
ncbi:putative dehydrogenase [Nonomuraea polychroma]|uniref:Putative dehydrogenase n=1 Tax=Nonomuraea polychroma TaxID=46176 RepID=A0A438LZC1_9ACTN|nr:Gfo/Idh/MocA family oxidoreductase [Nonomuraea polychroma]RVX38751.1 putative dehydrogenase [Nonomuraea polychroma]